MDVTAEILRNTMLYGSSDNTAPAGLSASRSLNYANGPSITRPENVNVSYIPFTLEYRDSIGLFGAENYFVKVNVKLDPTAAGKCFEEEYWECAVISKRNEEDLYWDGAEVLLKEDPTVVNTYLPARFRMGIYRKFGGLLSVDLNNLKTGNKYIDSWLDVRLYTSEREEHPYDRMYIRENDFFYIGFHARNTRRLPYNVDCLVGDIYIKEEDLTDDERRYIARRIS